MDKNNFIDNLNKSIDSNPAIFAKICALSLLLLGVLIVIGTFLDWDWIYEPDPSYRSGWRIGQVSRYLGRGIARIVGFFSGLLISFAGAAWVYSIFFKK